MGEEMGDRGMARTVLELSAEELRGYRPLGPQKTVRSMERWERAWKVARQAACILRERFAATRVIVFGSLTRETWFTPWSDIDLVAWGIPAGEFYRAVAVVTGLDPEFEIDLVDPDTCSPSLRQRIEREGMEV